MPASDRSSNPYHAPAAALGNEAMLGEPKPFELASIRNRMVAVVIDGALAYGLLAGMVSGFKLILPRVVRSIALWAHSRQRPGDSGHDLGLALVMTGTIVVLILIVAGLVGPFAALECTRSGATPGKRLMKIRVVGTDGARIGLGRAVLRNTSKLFLLMPWGLGGFVAFYGQNKQALHDRIAGTIVIRANPSRVASVVFLLCLVSNARADDARSSIEFLDRSIPAGVSFHYQIGSRGNHELPEIMGGGVAILDADGDGKLDLFFCNGGPIGAGLKTSACRLYRNRGDGAFEDVTDRSGAPGPAYAMGAAVGDVDGDGRDDLFVSGWRGQKLYRNLGDCRFEDITTQSHLESSLWGTSAALADLDGDGDLDLFVANYVAFDPEKAPFCSAPDGKRDYCGPEDFPAQPDRFYRNDGGVFVDISRSSGIDRADGRGLGVLIANLTGDSKLDIFVANDGSACHLFENRGNLQFVEVAMAAGVAFDGQGEPLAAMGVAAGDINADNHSDLLIANFFGRSTIGFLGDGTGKFRDESQDLGLVSLTRNVLGFGLALLDLDGDGALDLIQANGHVLDRARLGVPFAMRPTVARNVEGKFVDVSESAGDWARRPVLARGLAVGDLDGDGKPDVVISNLDAPPLVLKNVSHGRFLTIELVARPPSSRSAIGARLRASVGGKVLLRELTAGGSYLSSSDRRIALGLGSETAADWLEVRWPSGRVERWEQPNATSIKLEEGTGKPVRER